MNSRKIALLLVLVGCLCLPAPLYLSAAASVTAPPPQVSEVYYAEPVDPTTESGQAQIAGRHGGPVVFSAERVVQPFWADEYQASNATHRTLTTAIETGSATANDTGVQADLHSLARNYTFVSHGYGDDTTYYRFHLSTNGSLVRTQPVSTARVATVIVDRTAVRYATLSEGEQETVDKILNTTAEDASGYRPRINDPFVDQLPALVSKKRDTVQSQRGGSR